MGDFDERRASVYKRVEELGERTAILETLHASGSEGQKQLATAISKLADEIRSLALDINTLKTQRNTVIGVAGFIGSFITLVGEWIYRIMTKGG